MKQTIASVTNFLHCGEKYLFMRRSLTAAINPGELNGIGGKLEVNEDYVSAAIRETKEETGYIVSHADMRFGGIIRFEQGYEKEWITSFFSITVPDMTIPLGTEVSEGSLLWIHKDVVLEQPQLVDDIHYIFEDIVSGNQLFFMSVDVDSKTNKITRKIRHHLPV